MATWILALATPHARGNAQAAARAEAAQAPPIPTAGDACLDRLDPATFKRAVARLTLRPDSTRDTAVVLALSFLREDLGGALRARLGGSDSTLATVDGRLAWRDLQGAAAHVRIVASPQGFVWRADAETSRALVTLLQPMLDSLVASPPMLAWPETTTQTAAYATLGFEVPAFDSAGRPVLPDVGGMPAELGPPVFTLAHPWHTPALVLPPGPQVRYPEMVRLAGIEGFLQMRFTVTPEGRAERGSVRDVNAPRFAPRDADLAEGYMRFRQAVTAAIEQARYVPARVGGCRVARVVEQSFGFGFRRPGDGTR